MARQQARLGVGRLAAFRLNDTYPSVWCYINSIAVHDPGVRGVLVKPSIQINAHAEDDPWRASFELRDVTSPPTGGERVYLALGSTDNWWFSGNITNRKQTQSRYVDQPVWQIDCESDHRLFNRRLVRAKYTSRDAGDIIRDLVSTYCSGYSATRVSQSLGTVDEIEFTFERPTKAITRVMQRVGGTWYLDQRGVVHAFTGIEDGAPAFPTVSETAAIWRFTHDRDLSQVRTKVHVRGGGHALSDPAIAGSTQLFTEGNDYLQSATTIAVAPHFSGSAVEGYYQIASVGPSTSSVTFVVLASSIGGSGFLGAPKGSMVNVWATAQDVSAQSVLAGIEGGDGIHEHYLTDGRLTQPGADARAEAELTLFKDPEQHGTFATRNTNAWPGVRFAVSVASPTHISSVQVAMKAIRWGSFERSTRAWSSSRTSPWPEAAVEYSTGAVRDLYQILGDLEREGR